MAKARKDTASQPAEAPASSPTTPEDTKAQTADELAAEKQAELETQEAEARNQALSDLKAKSNIQSAPKIPDAPMSVSAGRAGNADEEAENGNIQTTGKNWTYSRVVFWPKRDKSDPETVKLKLNGVGLVFHRAVEVIVPDPYLEVADNALEDHFEQDPLKGRKKLAPVKKYGYDRMGKATEEDYLRRLKDGNANAKKYRMTMTAAN